MDRRESNLKEDDNQASAEPWDEYDDTIAFIYNWGFTFLVYVFLSFLIIGIAVEGFLSSHYDETLLVSAAVLCVLFLVTTVSARLALNEYPEFLTFIFKWSGITSYFVVAILSTILFSGNDSPILDINEFWKIARLICIFWMISMISTWITWLMMHDRQNMKMVLLEFVSFILKHAAVFCFLLGILCIAIFINGSFLGIYFDDTLGKLLIIICYILIVGVVSGCISLFTDNFKWMEYNTGVTWKMFTTKILAPRQAKFQVERYNV